jgi:hypothetical protein
MAAVGLLFLIQTWARLGSDMKNALKSLLNAMDKIAEDFEEVTDTDVREQMRRDAIHKTIIEPQATYVLPDEFGMFSPEGNGKVKAALAKLIKAARAEIKKAKVATPKARMAAFQDIEVESRNGATYDEYFGYDDTYEDRS